MESKTQKKAEDRSKNKMGTAWEERACEKIYEVSIGDLRNWGRIEGGGATII